MCDPVTALVVGTTIKVGSDFAAAEDAEDAYHAQSQISAANAKHRREIAEYNAGVFREQATRLRNEMAGRLNEVAGINIGRLQDDREINTDRLLETRSTNIARLEEALGLNASRSILTTEQAQQRVIQDRTFILEQLNQDHKILADRLGLDAEKDIGRIQQVTAEVVRRLGRRASEVAVTGFEVENDFREEIEQEVASQQTFYAAGNVVVNSGTPMKMKVDTYQRGEVMAQRIRRDYSIRVQELEDTASDAMRDALFQVDDIRTETSRRISDSRRLTNRAGGEATRQAGRELVDLNQTLAWTLDDLYKEAGYRIGDIDKQTGQQIFDINRSTDMRITDISRNLGYDLSDTLFEANKLDQQATLTMIQGDAEFSALMNQSDAQAQAGKDAFIGGTLGAIGNGIAGVSNIWYTAESLANSASVANSVPVVDSQPDFVAGQ